MISRYEQFSTAIARIYHAIQRIERVEMEKFGLKGPYVQCMLAMRQNPEGLTSGQLCSMCEKDKAAISRTLSELEQEGMVDRDVSGGNRFRAVLRLTQRGLDAANQVFDRVRLAVEKAGEGLSDAQRSVFYQVLSLISENLKTICTEGLAE